MFSAKSTKNSAADWKKLPHTIQYILNAVIIIVVVVLLTVGSGSEMF
jgi:hypothetical protein